MAFRSDVRVKIFSTITIRRSLATVNKCLKSLGYKEPFHVYQMIFVTRNNVQKYFTGVNKSI